MAAFIVKVNDSTALRIEFAEKGANRSPNLVGGAANNTVGADVLGATIGGGGGLFDSNPAPDSAD